MKYTFGFADKIIEPVIKLLFAFNYITIVLFQFSFSFPCNIIIDIVYYVCTDILALYSSIYSGNPD